MSARRCAASPARRRRDRGTRRRGEWPRAAGRPPLRLGSPRPGVPGSARGPPPGAERRVGGGGGAGPLHEVVNGILGETDRAPDGVIVGLVPAGRGSDYARGLGFDTGPHALVARYAAALEGDPSAARRVDAGEGTYRPRALVAGRPAAGAGGAVGAEQTKRRFVNEAGIGFSPLVAPRAARFPAPPRGGGGPGGRRAPDARRRGRGP